MYKHVETLLPHTRMSCCVFFFFKILRQETLVPFSNIDLPFSHESPNKHIDVETQPQGNYEIIPVFLSLLTRFLEREKLFLRCVVVVDDRRRERTASTFRDEGKISLQESFATISRVFTDREKILNTKKKFKQKFDKRVFFAHTQ